jgi:VWFA-related protein
MQRPAPKPESSEGRIQLDVVVRGKQGGPVAGLELKDFTLLDNKKPQPIVSFKPVEAPAAGGPGEVILLLDLVNSSFEQASIARQQIKQVLEQNGGHLPYPTSIMVLSPDGLRIQPHPSTNGNALAAMLGQAGAPAQKTTGLGEIGRFQLSVRSLASIAENLTKTNDRKILIWTGPGWPILGSSSSANSSQDRQRAFDTIIEISTRMREAHIALYNLSLRDSAGRTAGAAGAPVASGSPLATTTTAESPQAARAGPSMNDAVESVNYKEFLRGVKSARQADLGSLALQVLAIQSGGRVLDPSNDLANQIADCTEDLSSFYTISFNPAQAAHADDYHDLKVEIDKPGLTARTNTGYYNQP